MAVSGLCMPSACTPCPLAATAAAQARAAAGGSSCRGPACQHPACRAQPPSNARPAAPGSDRPSILPLLPPPRSNAANVAVKAYHEAFLLGRLMYANTHRRGFMGGGWRRG